MSKNRIEIEQFGARGRKPGELTNPQSVCITKNDLIFVTDSSSQRISAFDFNGHFKFCISSTAENLLKRPVGICENPFDESILITDYELRCVFVYDQKGLFKGRFGKVRFLGPKGICVNKSNYNEVIVADCKANLVYIFDSSGKFLLKFGEKTFSAPHYVCCSLNSDIIVSDFYNHCVRVFDSRGIFKWKIDGNFEGPTGVDVNLNNEIIIADWGRSRIQKFGLNGNFVCEISTKSNHLNGPQDLVIFNNELVVIADPGNCMIKFYKL